MDVFEEPSTLENLRALARQVAFRSGRDPAWAEDLLQSKLAQAWEEGGEEALRSFGALPFARRVLKNAAVDEFRRERRCRWVPLDTLVGRGGRDGSPPCDESRLDEIDHPDLVSRNQFELDEEEGQMRDRSRARLAAAARLPELLERLRAEHASAWRAREKERVLRQFGPSGIASYEKLTGVQLGDDAGTQALAERLGRSPGVVASWAHRAQKHIEKLRGRRPPG